MNALLRILSGLMALGLTTVPGLPVAVTACAGLSDDDETFFRQTVEPLLQRRCYECHSHAGSDISGGLALDWKSGWQNGGDRGPAVVPGAPDESLLIKAIRHSDPDLKMPEEKLPDDEIAVLVEWIRRGASDPRIGQPERPDAEEAANWWSLRPLVRPELPEVADDSTSDHPIDRFISARLAQAGLQASPQADRRTLIRRLSIDLLGLHPTPEDVDAFVRDESEQAYENLVDQFLASPAYGERWARHWFDTIHFADTHGYEHDALRPSAWRFRDYVIDSLNQDKPWDRFICEQLAADALYPEETHLTPALGFLGAGTYDHSAAATAIRAFENLDRDDMVSQTMSAFVSTTANCARCHQHKFDPISQEDYYSLQAVFAGIGKGEITYDADSGIGRLRRQWLTLKDAADRQDAAILLQPETEAMVAKWAAAHGPTANWQPMEIDTFVSVDAATLVRNPDGSISSTGPRPDKETTSVTCSTGLKTITAFRLDVLADPSLPMNGPGRMDNGNLHLTEFEVSLFQPDAPESKRLGFRRASADFDQAGWTSTHAIDGNLTTAWGIHPQVGQSHFAVFELSEPLAVPPGSYFSILMRQIHGGGHIIGRFSLSVTDSDAEITTAMPRDVEEILQLSADQRNPEQRLRLASHLIQQQASEELQKLPAPSAVYAAGTRATNERGVITFTEPRKIHVLRRGDIDRPEEEVSAGALSAIRALPSRFELSDPKNESLRRAALAKWISHRDNPLTWRSIVNRTWHYHLGTGLCDTPSDFGRMGGTPSHPELLDWLAVWFRDDAKGSLKQLHRLIVTSAAYRQSSASRPEAAAVDTDNRLVWRMNSHRLDADCVRDAVLVASGQLDRTMGGPGVAHFLSSPGPQLTPILDYSSFDWNTPGANRRSIYRIVWRGIQDPFFEALDFPDLGVLSPTRGFSASALQSLVLWNNNFMLHHAEKFALRLESIGSTTDDQVRAAVRICWLRNPTDEEFSELQALAASQGLPALCRLLLNSNEFLFVQ